MSSIPIDELANTVNNIMKEFEGATDAAIQEALRTTSKSVVERLKNANPAGSGKYSPWSKKYNRGWTVSSSMGKSRKKKTATIHNATEYRLTHLLEKGYVKKNGKRSKKFPHIEEQANYANDKLFEEIKRNI